MGSPFANSPAFAGNIQDTYLFEMQKSTIVGELGRKDMVKVTGLQLRKWLTSAFSNMWNFRGNFDSATPPDAVGNDVFNCTGTFTEDDVTYTANHLYAYNGLRWDDVTNLLAMYVTADALEAVRQDLQDQIDELAGRGRYLGGWNCTTGLAVAVFPTLPYEYKQGDHFSIALTGATNYKPNGSSYTGVASTTVESEVVRIGDTYLYDGANWIVQHESVSFAQIQGAPSDNAALDAALDGKANKSEMSITPGTGVDADKTNIQLKSGTSATVLTQHQDVSGKADKDTDAVVGDFAVFDASGNPVDSSKKPSDYVPKSDIVNDLTSTATDKPLSANMGKSLNNSKADKVVGATNNHLASLDGNGNLKDSGIPATIFKVAVSMAVTTNPTKTMYRVGEQFDPTGMVATITYSDGSTESVSSGFIYSEIPFKGYGSQSFKVGYENLNTVWATITVQVYMIYGFKINGSESQPGAMVSYIEDAKGMRPAFMNYTAGVFEYGDWENAFFMPRPCMLKFDGTVDYYLNPDDYTLKEDGTASDVANTSYNGNAMMEWGQNGVKIWYKVVQGNSTKDGYVYIAPYQVDSSYKAWSFINNQGQMVDHFYTPIYNGSVISSKLRSISGRTYSQLCQNNTASAEVTYAKANNPGADVMWNTEVYADIQIINFLLILIGKSCDMQGTFGGGRYGQTSSAEYMLGTGTMNTRGLFWGHNSGTYGVKVFGMENWWGNQWRRYAGHINASGTQKIKLTYGTQDGSSASSYNTDGSGYITISSATPGGTSGGYISEMKFDTYGMHPKTASGSSSTYFCDGLWFNNGQTNYAFRGGSCSDDARVGAFCCSLNGAASSTRWHIGAAVSCKPLAS